MQKQRSKWDLLVFNRLFVLIAKVNILNVSFVFLNNYIQATWHNLHTHCCEWISKSSRFDTYRFSNFCTISQKNKPLRDRRKDLSVTIVLLRKTRCHNTKISTWKSDAYSPSHLMIHVELSPAYSWLGKTQTGTWPRPQALPRWSAWVSIFQNKLCFF